MSNPINISEKRIEQIINKNFVCEFRETLDPIDQEIMTAYIEGVPYRKISKIVCIRSGKKMSLRAIDRRLLKIRAAGIKYAKQRLSPSELKELTRIDIVHNI